MCDWQVTNQTVGPLKAGNVCPQCLEHSLVILSVNGCGIERKEGRKQEEEIEKAEIQFFKDARVKSRSPPTSLK